MNKKRWQYPANSQPVLSIPRVETIHLPMWEPEMPQSRPVVRAITTAILAGCLFFTPFVVAQAETITLDKWYEPTSEPIRQVQPAPLPPISSQSGQINQTLGPPAAWRTPLSEPVRDVQRGPLPPISSAWGQINQALGPLAAWLTPVSEPVRTIPPSPLPPISTPTGQLNQGRGPLDAWLPRLSEPVRLQTRIPLDETIEPLHIPVRPPLSAWSPEMDRPVQPRPTVPDYNPASKPVTVPIIVVIPPLPAWEARNHLPVWAKTPIVAEGITVIDPTALNIVVIGAITSKMFIGEIQQMGDSPIITASMGLS